jgi:hypothetical protein
VKGLTFVMLKIQRCSEQDNLTSLGPHMEMANTPGPFRPKNAQRNISSSRGIDRTVDPPHPQVDVGSGIPWPFFKHGCLGCFSFWVIQDKLLSILA